jgi:serine O-acetyltransferase
VTLTFVRPSIFFQSHFLNHKETLLEDAKGIQFNFLFGSAGEDFVWNMIRSDASIGAASEPLLASFMHATILSQKTLEKALAFHIANQLQSPAMISTQIQALLLEVFEKDKSIKVSLRQDIVAVMDRDPAVKSSTDVLLYFKGFQALQTHRVSHWLWNNDRKTLALFLNSRLNSVYQIDIHPGAQMGSGILLDHGTGIVIGETAVVGNNVSMLHQVNSGLFLPRNCHNLTRNCLGNSGRSRAEKRDKTPPDW